MRSQNLDADAQKSRKLTFRLFLIKPSMVIYKNVELHVFKYNP